MELNHIYISLELSQQVTQALKAQFSCVVAEIENKQMLAYKDMMPLADMLSDVINGQAEFIDLFQNKLKTGDFFAIHLQHHDPEILNLPWCMAKDAVSGKRIENISQIYFINHLVNDQGVGFADTTIDLAPLPLKILVMISSPENASYKNRLDYESEELAILHAFEPLLQAGAVEIHFTNNGSLDELKRKVNHNKYHMLHFSGHGTFKEGKGYLVLEDDLSLKTTFVPGTDIAKALIREDGHRIPLVMLSACQSAAGSIEKGFHNVTRDLLEHGFPNIIAMTMSVLDNHATQFARALYDQLNQEKSILYAFHEAIRYLKKFELTIIQQRFGANAAAISPFQYTIPRLYARTQDFRLFDAQATPEKARMESCAYIFKQSKYHQKIPEFVFIGRRQEKAALLSPLFNHKPVQIKGMGGVGKTALAIHLSQRYLARHPHALPFFFNEECQSSESILQALKKALMKKFRINATSDLEVFDTGTEKIMFLIERFIEKGSRPVFIFDNLESFQQDIGGAFQPKYSDIAETITAICEDQQVPILLTSRYNLPDIKHITQTTDLNQIQLTDFWKKCLQLDMADMQYDIATKKLDLSESLLPGQKLSFHQIVQILHTAFGGNFRALEFFNEIYKQEKQRIYQTLNELRNLPEKYKQDTLIKMSENLIFAQLIHKLNHSQKQLLYLLAHFNVPVQTSALNLQLTQLQQSHASMKKQLTLPQHINKDLNTLKSYTLIEMQQSLEHQGIYNYVTPIVKGLLRLDVSESILKDIADELSFSHQMAGQYFYALFHNQRVDGLSELSEAFDHFYLAGDQDKLNDIGNRLVNFYYESSYFQKALTYCKKVEQLCGEATDEWFYNRLGLIYKLYGKNDEALIYYEKELIIEKKIGDRQGEGATLNNISQIHDARGDYETALRYLEQSLEIRREIGDRQGEGATLNNISQIHKARGDYETALRYLEQSLEIRREIGDRQGEGTTLNNISQIHKARGDYETALRYLEQSLEITREIGDRKVEGTTLTNIGNIYYARGDDETALRYLEQSLEIRREIGNRQGEGTTLNNISQIHDARGDYETALRYLEQSLEIRREIGDRSGMCATLFNMGHIHSQNNDHQNAVKQWVTSYRIAKQIGYAQVLAALENLAKQSGGNDLSFWDDIADKMGID
jgi:tetratricopeptide (TPR) repeat protein